MSNIIARVWIDDVISEPDVSPNKKESKAAIVDILQENIRRYYTEEALIPVVFLMKRIALDKVYNQMTGERGANLSSSGTHKHTCKSQNSITGAELRVVWRLMNELNDSVIAHILKETVSAVCAKNSNIKSDGTFDILSVESMELPWETSEEEKLKWENRERKHASNKGEMYETHKALQLSPDYDWLTRLLWFKNTMSKTPCQKGDNLPFILIAKPNTTQVISKTKYVLGAIRKRTLSFEEDSEKAAVPAEYLVEHLPTLDLEGETVREPTTQPSDFTEENSSSGTADEKQESKRFKN